MHYHAVGNDPIPADVIPTSTTPIKIVHKCKPSDSPKSGSALKWLGNIEPHVTDSDAEDKLTRMEKRVVAWEKDVWQSHLDSLIISSAKQMNLKNILYWIVLMRFERSWRL